MEDDEPVPFSELLQGLQDPPKSKRNDPKCIRLAAVTAAIVESVEQVTPHPVFAQGIAALEGTLKKGSDSAPTQLALLEVLYHTISHVSPPVLAGTLPLTSRVLRALVVDEHTHEQEGGGAILRWTCKVTARLLGRLQKAEEKAVRTLLMGTLLGLFHDRRPKIRKAAQNELTDLLHQNCLTSVKKISTSYVRTELKKTDNLPDLLHLLAFVKQVVFCLNYKGVCSDLMELLNAFLSQTPSSSDFVTTHKIRENTPKLATVGSILAILHNVLQDDNHNEFVREFAPRVVASLLQAKPSLILCDGAAEDEVLQQTRITFGQVILSSCTVLVDFDEGLACKLLPLSIQMVLSFCRDNEEVSESLMVELTQLFRTKLPVFNISEKCMQDLLTCMEQVTAPPFRVSWDVSLKALVVLLQNIYDKCRDESANTVEILLDLHGDVPVASPAQRAVENAVSMLIQATGIEQFWKWIRWQSGAPSTTVSFSEGIDKNRVWIFSTIKSAAMASQSIPPRLSCFQTDVLGLARVCDKLAVTGPTKQRKYYHSRVIDLWSLFPCFCKSPVDLEASMPSLTLTLSRAMSDKRYSDLLTVICNGLSVLVKSIDENGGFELDAVSADMRTLAETATKLLPTLFQFVAQTHEAVAASKKASDQMEVDEQSRAGDSQPIDGYQKLQCVTEAISSLACLAPSDFLHGLFKKLMHKLLEEIQSEAGDSEKVCSFLTLSQALVASEVLDESSISFLYRALRPLIRNDEHGSRVQKRAYKVLAEICERHHSFVVEPERLNELATLLTGTIMTAPISARYMRLKCMNTIVEGFDDESDSERMKSLHQVATEVLLCLKDANAKTRDAAYELLLSMASKGDIVVFVNILFAALGAKSSHMRSAVVMALSRIVFELGWESDQLQSVLPGLLQTVLVLINEGSREVTKSVIGFIRICVAAIPREQLEPLLPELIGSMLNSPQAKSRFRAKVKIILKKLVKQFGYDALMEHVPSTETRLLTHMRKLDQREKRKKLARKEDGRMQVDQFDDMIGSDEEDSDDGRTFVTGATGLTKLSARSKAKSAMSSNSKKSAILSATSAKSAKHRDATFRLPNETDGEVVDMLGSKMSRRVHFAEVNGSDSDSDDGAMEFDDEGRLVIHDSEESAPEDVIPMDGPNKRRRVATHQSVRTTKNESKKKNKESTRNALGAAYKSKKAGGDVKRKGQKFEPYAYVPLDGRAYSKKNRRAAVEQMSTVIPKGGKRKR